MLALLVPGVGMGGSPVAVVVVPQGGADRIRVIRSSQVRRVGSIQGVIDARRAHR